MSWCSCDIPIPFSGHDVVASVLCAHSLRFVIDSWDRFIGLRKRVSSSYHFVHGSGALIFNPSLFRFELAGWRLDS